MSAPPLEGSRARPVAGDGEPRTEVSCGFQAVVSRATSCGAGPLISTRATFVEGAARFVQTKAPNEEGTRMDFRIVIDEAVLRACWLASLAQACGWKRACRHYLLDAQILMTTMTDPEPRQAAALP